MEGCEIEASSNITVTSKVKLDNSVRARILEQHPHYYQFRWLKGPKSRMCANEACNRCSSHHPFAWSRQAGARGLICWECQRAGLHRSKTSFCSVDCFKSSWPVHSLNHRVKADSEELDVANNDEGEWTELFQGKRYVPEKDDIGHTLRIECSVISEATDEVLAGPLTLQTEAVLSMPEKAPRRDIMANSNNSANRGGMPLRVVSYNILSEIYATKQMYPHLDTWALAWPYRRMLIIKELMEMHADVVCLQEVQADHYERDLLPTMQQMGYDGVYCHKSRESMGAYGKVDGCAIFWNCSRLMLADSYHTEFNELAREEARRRGFSDAQTRKYINALCKDNVAQVVILEYTSNVQQQVGPIVVGNTHLYANYMRPDVRLWQAYFFLSELSQIANSRDAAVILCGDWNSEPDSAVYEFMRRGRIVNSRPELAPSGDINVLPKLDEIRHNFDFQSVMAMVMGQEPSFTNFTAGYKGVLDYIWITQPNIQVTHVLVPPSEADLTMRAGVGLPSTRDPSDHIALCADLSINTHPHS